MNRPTRKHHRLEVWWEDSHSPTIEDGYPWANGQEVVEKMGSKPVMCVTLGFVLSESKHQIVLAGQISDSGQVAGVVAIAKSAIRKRRRLALP